MPMSEAVRPTSGVLHGIGIVLLLAALPAHAQQSGEAPAAPVMDWKVLPASDPTGPSITVLDARAATPPPRSVDKSPVGAPNVLVGLLDNPGFGQSNAFGERVNILTPGAWTRGGVCCIETSGAADQPAGPVSALERALSR